MSSRHSTDSSSSVFTPPTWFAECLGISLPPEGERVKLRDQSFVMRGGILRSEDAASNAQGQTEKAFGFKWNQRHTFESESSLTRMREWLWERYGEVEKEP